ncbi:MAG TPA: rod shape-determining protein MreC [Candidatus Hydrogenedentes bacterium]|nr:rod shape-determining protein MreC [Candidatus Hydrogenedentota bacterium]
MAVALSRRISEHRPAIVLLVIVALSLASMAGGKRAGFIGEGLRIAVSATSYPFLKAMKSVQGAAGYVAGLVFSYNAYRTEVETARSQLADAMQHTAQRNELLQENRRLRQMIDFARTEQRFALEAAEVIESFKGATVTIDRGSLRGIAESMCAITENGVVGMVTRVGPFSATVVTLRNTECRIGAMIARNRVRGIVQGSGSDISPYCSMNYIDMKDDVQPGDRVVASPESLFPTGYPIGRVVAVHETGSLWKSADVEPAVNPYRLDEIFIVRETAPSAGELAGTPPAEPLSATGPDDRPLQERLAP